MPSWLIVSGHSTFDLRLTDFTFQKCQIERVTQNGFPTHDFVSEPLAEAVHVDQPRGSAALARVHQRIFRARVVAQANSAVAAFVVELVLFALFGLFLALILHSPSLE